VVVFGRLCCSVVIVWRFRVCLFVLVGVQLQTMESSREFSERPIPGFFRNSCAGSSAVEGGKDEDLVIKSDVGNGKLTSPPDERQKVVSGITCCVPTGNR